MHKPKLKNLNVNHKSRNTVHKSFFASDNVNTRNWRFPQCLPSVSLTCAIFVAMIVLVTIFSMALLHVSITSSASSSMPSTISHFHWNAPANGKSNPTLLFMTASYSMDQFLFLQKVVDSLKDICNHGWDVTLHLSVANGLNETHSRFQELVEQSYCVRTDASIPIILEIYDKIGFGLNSRHRLYLKKHYREYDYVSFAEEDMLLTVSLLESFLKSERNLKVCI